MNGYYELKPTDDFISKNYKPNVTKEMIGMFRYAGQSESGGFYDTPFGSDTYSKFWTVMGNDINKPKFECGSNHRVGEGYVPDDENPHMIYTHHSIFFRGAPLTDDEASARLARNKRR